MIAVVCAPDAGDGIVGVAPVRVECLVAGTAGATWDTVRWSFGDGGTSEGAVGAHVYAGSGTFDVTAELVGFRETPTDAPVEVAVSNRAYVTVCSGLEVKFTWNVVGGRVIRVVDTSVAEPACVRGRVWTVRDGRGVVFGPTVEREDLVLLPEGGPFTVRLELDGVAGPAAAEALVEVR